MSKVRKGVRVLNRDFIYKVETPNDGIFYIKTLTIWHKLVKHTYYKNIKYTKIYDINHKLWDEKPLILNKLYLK